MIVGIEGNQVPCNSTDGHSPSDSETPEEKCVRTEVDKWCAAHSDEWFSVRALFGADWNAWEPLQRLYEEIQENHEEYEPAKKAAGQQVGRLLKCVVCKHERKFVMEDRDRALHYKLQA